MKAAGAKAASPDTTEAVDAFMSKLDHPHKAAIEEIRKVIRGAHRSIAEGVKWNSPSFRTTEYFATTHLKAKKGVALILHLGAKVRETAQPSIADPDRLLTWLGKDRAMVTFEDVSDVKARAKPLAGIVRAWIEFV